MNDFIQKIKHIFGDVQYSVKRDHRGVLKCRLPRIIGELCKYLYDIRSFGTFDSRIPKKLLSLNKENKIAFIITGIIDEGSITYDGDIQFGVSNRDMITEFRNLCEELGLETTEIKGNKSSEHYHFYIKSKEKLRKIYIPYNEKYPLISLRYKEERLKKALEIKEQKFYYTKEFADKRRDLILKELNKKESSINNLAIKFLISPKTIRRYMYRLIKENKVYRIKTKNEFIYYIRG